MQSDKINQLAEEIVKCRDIELADKLLKIKDLLEYNDDPGRVKYEIFKFGLLDALSVAFENEYGFVEDGWSKAAELVAVFRMCTCEVNIKDKYFQGTLLPQALENVLVLAKKFQEKYIKSKLNSDEFLKLYRRVLLEYTLIIESNSYVAFKCFKSERLQHLLVSDEIFTSAFAMQTYKLILMAKKTILKQVDDTTLFAILDEVVYHMALSDVAEIGRAIFQLINAICKIEPDTVVKIVRRYKGVKLLVKKWQERISDVEVDEFFEALDSTKETYLSSHRQKEPQPQRIQNNVKIAPEDDLDLLLHDFETDPEKRNKVIFLQRALRSRLQREERIIRNKAEQELQFELLLQHHRRLRQRHMERKRIIEILPPNQLQAYLEKQQNYSAKVIQTAYRGFRERKRFNHFLENNLGIRRDQFAEYARERDRILKAVVVIQRGFRKWLKTEQKRRNEAVFYSRPPGLDATRREALLDQVRQYLDSLPPHPRSESAMESLHDRAQRSFHNYVMNQQKIRIQNHNIEAILASVKNDSDLILNCPKFDQVTEEDISNYYSSRSQPIALEAKTAHKKLLRKHRSNWFELLNDDSGSDDDQYIEDELEDVANSMRNMNFAQNNRHYRQTNVSERVHEKLGNTRGVITLKERNQLKTSILRKKIMVLMKNRPDQSHVWLNDDAEKNLELNVHSPGAR